MTVKDILDLSTDDIDIYDVNNTDDRMIKGGIRDEKVIR